MIMKLDIIKSKGLDIEWRITVPSKDISPKFEEEYSNLSKNVKLPGFRPGKVPIKIVKQKYAQNVTQKILDEVINFSLRKTAAEKKIQPSIQPKVKVEKYEEGGDLILSKEGSIRSRGYQSDVAGSGFILTAASGGFLEVENAKIRGTLSTATFEKESVNAVGGQLYIANSTVLTGSSINPGGIHTATQNTMSVENASGFVQGEILAIKKVSPTGFNTEYV